MAASKSRRRRTQRRQSSRSPRVEQAIAPTDPDVDAEIALREIQRLMDTPLVDLMAAGEERAHVEQLTRRAAATPALARLGEVVAFVGGGRRATSAGNLTIRDALTLAARLNTGEAVPERVRSIDDLADTAHAFRWAAAAELVTWRGTKIVAGPSAADLERDPLSAWIKAAVTLFERGPLGGFRSGWRKNYVEVLDASAPSLLVAMAEAGGVAPVAAIEHAAWEQVAATYGYDPDDQRERSYVDRLAGAMVAQLADLGILERREDQVVLTGLGETMAVVADLASDDDLDDVDLIDTDAQSLLLVCVEELTPTEAQSHLRAWCDAREPEQAAAELCEAMADEGDAALWDLGLEALGMIDPGIAEPAIRHLESHPGLGARATEWRRTHGRGHRA